MARRLIQLSDHPPPEMDRSKLYVPGNCPFTGGSRRGINRLWLISNLASLEF